MTNDVAMGITDQPMAWMYNIILKTVPGLHLATLLWQTLSIV